MKYTLLLITIFSFAVDSFAQVSRYTLKNYNVKDGLSQNSIIRITEDSNGYIWIATRDGLNKFNGVEFDVLRSGRDNYSLSSSDITSVVEDKDKNLWVSTHKGLNMLNRRDGTTRKFYHSSSDTTTISNDCVKHICCDSRNRIWIGTIDGLDLFDRQSNTFRHIAKKAMIWILEDSFGNILYVNSDGLFKINPDNFKITKLNLGQDLQIYSLFEDSRRRIWIGTWYDGLWYIDNEKVVKANLTSEAGDNFNKTQIGYIVEFQGGELMLATRKGVVTYNIAQNRVTKKIVNDGHGNLNDNAVITLYKDSNDNVWIGTWSGGLSVYSPYSNYFTVHTPRRDVDQPLGNINAMVEDGNQIWFATDDGLMVYNRKNESYSFVELNTDNNPGYSMREIRYIHRENERLMWISIYANGLYLFDMKSRKIVKTIKGFNYAFARKIEKQSDGKYWIATNTNEPLLRYDINTGIFEDKFPIKGSKHSFAPINVQDILVDDNNLWVGTRSEGLYRYNLQSNEVKIYTPKTKNKIACGHISSIFKDNGGGLWFGTFGKGVGSYNASDDTFKMYDSQNGLSNGAICGIIDCSKDALWVSTLGGVSKLDFATQSFENWGYNNGYPMIEASLHACMASSDGVLFVGGKDMFISYNPNVLKKNPNIPNTYITKYNIWDENKERVGQKWRDIHSDRITLKYNQTSFSIKFVALNYVFPENNSYAYKLEGFDNDWVYCGNTNVVSYTNIPSGKYKFRVKASNNDGLWNNDGDVITIVVNPALWFSWWAFLIYVVIVGSLAFIFIKNRVRETKLETDLKIKQAEKNSLEQAHQIQMRMFTNFAHELRTPLTLIMGPLGELQQRKDLTARVTNMLDLIGLNAKRLLWLVNQLMDLRKLETKNMKFTAVNDNFNLFIDEIILSFEEYSKSKEVQLKLDDKFNGDNLWYDPMLLEKVFLNILSNAFKHTPKGGEIVISTEQIALNDVAVERVKNPAVYQHGALLVSIKDTGRGIPNEVISKIFDPFYQTPTGDLANIYGTGIGLSLCRAIIELHQGDIWAESDLGQGTTINILLPLGKAHLTESTVEKFFMKSDVDKDEILHDLNTDNDEANNILNRHKNKVLIIEDNEDVKHFLSDILKERYHIVSAADCMEGCDVAMKELPDIIVSDIMTPRMNGLQLCERLKNDNITSHIPIILLTALTAPAEIKDGLDSLADDYILKPFDPELLKVRIANILANRERLRGNFMKNFSTIGLVKNNISIDDKFLNNVFDYVKENIDDSNLTIDGLSEKMAISRVQLFRKIKAVCGVAPSKLILDMRLKMAAELLQNTNMTVSEVAYKCGFSEVSYFGKRFKSIYGVSPSSYGRR